jgi:hypothetical protein
VLLDYHATGTWHFQPLYLWLTYAPFFAVWGLARLRSSWQMFALDK